MVVFLSSVLSNVSRAWKRGDAEARQRLEVRLVFDFLGSDLRAATLPVVPPADPTQPNLQFLLNPSSDLVPEACRNADALFWQAPIATDASLGDLAEIGYFVKWDSSRPSNPRGQLCRFFVNPTDNDSYLIYRSLAWLSPALLETVAPADDRNVGKAKQRAGYRGLLAENVLGFWTRWRDDKKQLVKQYDSRATANLNRLPASIDVSLLSVQETNALRIGPAEQATIQATVRLADDATDALGRLGKIESLSLVRPGLRTYQTTIYLEGSGR